MCPDAYSGTSLTANGGSTITYSAWDNWNAGYYATTNATTWTTWVGCTTSGGTTSNGVYFNDGPWFWPEASGGVSFGQPETDEQRAARESTQRAYAAEQEERERKRAIAAKTAQETFERMLTVAQRKEVEAVRYFTVESKGSKRRYRVYVNQGRHGNIKEVDSEGREVKSLCCAPGGNIPEHDAFLGQKLFLEHDEDAFVRAANVTTLRVA